ncbi:MAG: hypothetical protein P0Y64_16585 [Candidatus Sphingomonas colombiensis]|nr:hypothetical protein [Sphingomonas sp.]WEK42936.1 MAG: hypothetical protein P0Y64_16585 [Sphingomonas sp.]
MALLQQNSEGCAQNHYGEDFALFGMPGWLAGTRRDLNALPEIITALTALDAGRLETTDDYAKFDGVGPHAETVETRARIGERYLEAYESALSDPRVAGYTPADCPSELLLDLLERLPPPAAAPDRKAIARVIKGADDGVWVLVPHDEDAWTVASYGPPAVAPEREAIARVIDPLAWQDHATITRMANAASGKRIRQHLDAADNIISPSLAKADAILTLYAAHDAEARDSAQSAGEAR